QVAKLNQKHAGSFVEIHPDDARKLGVIEGDHVMVASQRGACASVARLNPDIAPGTLFMPIHWSDGNPNRATNPVFDPTSRQPELKACMVFLVPSGEPLELAEVLEQAETAPR